ncbi:MAG: DMT family transporter [Rhodospirillales bacterium]
MESSSWIAFTLAAATLQAVRTAGQKHLTTHLTSVGTTLVRFLFGLPFVLLYLFILLQYFEVPFPELTQEFLISTLIASLFQIVGTIFLVYLFSLRNFAVGTTYSKTEAFLTAIVAMLFFGEIIPLAGWLAIAVSVIGMLVINAARASAAGMSTFERYWNKAAAVGLATGLCMSFSSLMIRKSSLSLELDNVLLSAGVTLATMVCIQTTVLGVYVAVRSPNQIRIAFENWKPCLFVGITSIGGSILWFTAYTLEQVSYVKALGQIEMVFVIFLTTLFFKERITSKEMLGIILVTSGVLLLITTA